MADKRDYYEVLGVDKKADADSIKKAYRKAAKESHPDLHPNDKKAEERFKEVNEAYEVLSDDNKRARYDQFGHDAPNMGGPGGYGGFSGFDQQGFGQGFDSIFDFFFSGGEGASRQAQRNGPQRGQDLRYDLTISFEEAAFGAKKEFKFYRMENCETCKGSGAKVGTEPQTCPTCKGSGQVKTTSQSLFGQVVNMRACQTCGGTGKIIQDKCPKCVGKGRVRMMRTATVTIPAGIDNGQQLNVMHGQGDAGLRGGPSGDLYVVVSVKPHKTFRRDGYNLYCEFTVSMTQAALGGEIELPTLEGPMAYPLPEGTQNDTVLRIKGKGIQMLRGNGKGDLFAKIRVEIPKRLSEKQKQLLRELDDSMGNGKKGFFGKNKGKG